MMAPFFVLLTTATLLILQPCPVTPRVTGPLTTSDIMDHGAASSLYDMDDLMDVLRDSGNDDDDDDLSSLQDLPPRNRAPQLFRFPRPGPVGLRSGSGSDWERFQSLHPRVQDFEPSSSVPVVFPIPGYGGGGEDRSFMNDRVHTVAGDRSELSPVPRAAPFGLVSYGGAPVKRGGRLSYCHLLGFPMSSGCLQERRAWGLPQTRSPSGPAFAKVQRKSSPSLYLFGGAVGR